MKGRRKKGKAGVKRERGKKRKRDTEMSYLYFVGKEACVER